jgi:hypothetical protein
MPEEKPHARDGRGGTSFAAASAVDSGREWSQIRAVCCAAGPPASFARAGFADGTPAGEKKKKEQRKEKARPNRARVSELGLDIKVGQAAGFPLTSPF